MQWPRVIFVTGIGTDVGKSFVAGWLAREIRNTGKDVITQKMIQTGNTGMSEDIIRHRQIMGLPLQKEDLDHTTAPIIFTYPASPHLAAEIDGKTIDTDIIDESTRQLLKTHDHVVMEGAGGLMVPIDRDVLTADYLSAHHYPTVVAVTGQLGSINHALLTLTAIKSYGIPLLAVVYNPYFDKDDVICDDTRHYLKTWLADHFESSQWLEMPVLG